MNFSIVITLWYASSGLTRNQSSNGTRSCGERGREYYLNKVMQRVNRRTISCALLIQSLIHFEEKDQRYVTLNVSAKHIIHLQETPHNSFDSSIFFFALVNFWRLPTHQENLKHSTMLL